jgi:hypothetical protein
MCLFTYEKPAAWYSSGMYVAAVVRCGGCVLLFLGGGWPSVMFFSLGPVNF